VSHTVILPIRVIRFDPHPIVDPSPPACPPPEPNSSHRGTGQAVAATDSNLYQESHSGTDAHAWNWASNRVFNGVPNPTPSKYPSGEIVQVSQR